MKPIDNIDIRVNNYGSSFSHDPETSYYKLLLIGGSDSKGTENNAKTLRFLNSLK